MSKDYQTEEIEARKQRLKNEMTSISARIREARNNAGITQAALADFAGISTSTIVRYEHCDDAMCVETLFRIASALNLNLADLISDNKYILYKYSLLQKQDQELIRTLIDKCYASSKCQI